MEELVYSRHLKCLGFGHAGSTPAARTKFRTRREDSYSDHSNSYRIRCGVLGFGLASGRADACSANQFNYVPIWCVGTYRHRGLGSAWLDPDQMYRFGWWVNHSGFAFHRLAGDLGGYLGTKWQQHTNRRCSVDCGSGHNPPSGNRDDTFARSCSSKIRPARVGLITLRGHKVPCGNEATMRTTSIKLPCVAPPVWWRF